MPRVSRGFSSNSSNQHQPTSSGSNNHFGNLMDHSEEDHNGSYTLPKHIPFPDIPFSSELMNELITFLFILFSCAMQFLHIYRTVWWLPDLHTNHAINFYLIDPYLVAFIITIISRRLIYCAFNLVLERICREKRIKFYKLIFKYTFTGVHVIILTYCTLKIFSRQNYLHLFLLLYPLIVYILIFGPKIESYFRITNEIENSYLNGMPVHSCSLNPVAIRDEIEVLKNDFNNRFKQVIFTSVINAYYASYVPCFFAQNYIYYDIMRATQHNIFVWFSGFTMCTVFCFPAKYCDILHKAALHLGQWKKIDGGRTGNPLAIQISSWSKGILWSTGSIVRYNGELYKANGPVTTALPGNVTHSRFFRLFCDPAMLFMILTGLQTFLVVLQILLLFFSREWYNIISLSFLILANHHTLFKVARDYIVTQKIYAAESSIYEKLSCYLN